jgi:hypothetical protein
MESEAKGGSHPSPSLTVITPVGPGHHEIAERAQRSVIEAGKGAFNSVVHDVILDKSGVLGRSGARNSGIRRAKSGWLFFLDADDMMRPDALFLIDPWATATFGAVSLDGKILDNNVWPCTWRDIALVGAAGTLSMGFFCRTDVAQELLFNEELDTGEDFEFYLRLPDFTKRRLPLVDIGYSTPSATGPRGYRKIDWTGICNAQIVKAIEREPEKFDLRGDAVLAKVRSTVAKPPTFKDAIRAQNRDHRC